MSRSRGVNLNSHLPMPTRTIFLLKQGREAVGMQAEQSRIVDTERKLAGLEHSLTTYEPVDEADSSFSRLRIKVVQEEIESLRLDLTRLETEDLRRTVHQRETSRARRKIGNRVYMGIMAVGAVMAMLAIGLVLSGLVETPIALAKIHETSHLVASVFRPA